MQGTQHAPARTVVRKPSPRSALVLVAIAAAIAVIAVVAMSPDGPAAPRTSLVEDGGLEWGPIVVVPDGDEATLEATVELDDKAFPVADGSEDEFVMYQLAGGRFDTNEHVNDLAAEKTLGFDANDRFLFNPSGDGLDARVAALPKSGEYTLSLDGSIEYGGIPKGTWELRAYVVDRTGSWDGAVAVRSVEVA